MNEQTGRRFRCAGPGGLSRLGAALAGAALLGSFLAAGCSALPAKGVPAKGVPVKDVPAASAAATRTAGSPPTVTPATRPAGLGPVRKILVIMEENHSIQQVFPRGMPYLWSLARRYSYASDWSDVAHPSLPNYLAIFGGSAFNDPPDCLPGPGCAYPGPSVFGQALARGESARAYQESMPQPCDQVDSGEYDVNHNPWVYFPGEAANCRADDVAAGTPGGGALAADVRRGALPAVGLVTPDLLHDGHDGTAAQADAWLRTWVPVLLSGPDWRSGRLAVVVVFDEGESTEQVAFVLMTPRLSGVTISAAANQYALTQLIDMIIGAPPLRRASTATDIRAALEAG